MVIATVGTVRSGRPSAETMTGSAQLAASWGERENSLRGR